MRKSCSSRRRYAANLVLLCALILLAMPRATWAWGGAAHADIAAAAQYILEHQNPARNTLVNARALLAKDKSECSVEGDPPTNLNQVSSWADAVKGVNELGAQHDVSLPICGVLDWGAACKALPNSLRLGSDYHPCVADGIVFYAGVLGDTDRDDGDRLQALKNLVHMVGDIHQPLHCSDPGGDAYVKVQKLLQDYYATEDLHSIWDREIHENAGVTVKNITDRQATIANNCDVGRSLLKRVQCWALEGNTIARDQIYKVSVNGCPPTDPPPGDKCGSYAPTLYCASEGNPFPLPYTGQTYYQANKEIVVDRMALASIRLAKILNDALGSLPTPTPAPPRAVKKGQDHAR